MFVFLLLVYLLINPIACPVNKTFKQPTHTTRRTLNVHHNDENIKEDDVSTNTTMEVPGDFIAKPENLESIQTIKSESLGSAQTINAASNPKPIDTKRKPIKLNMAQGLLMNQVLGIYALDDVNNSLCRNHSLEFKNGLRGFEPWALKMFDSSSKLQSGILAGNVMEFGSFKQCIHIHTKSDYGPIRGQQCTIQITPTMNVIQKILAFRNVSPKRFEKVRKTIEGVSLYWSVCVPESCTPEDVLNHFTKHIKTLGEGLELDVKLTHMDCFALKDQPKLTYKEYITISILSSLFVIICLCTLVDFRNRARKEENGTLTYIFSAYSNAEFVFTYTTNDISGFGCLHGIRFLSTCYVVLGHRFLMTLFFPSVNGLELMEWLLKYPSTIVIGGTVSVDSFFTVTGILIAYYTMQQLSAKNGKLNCFFYILYRYIRITLPYGLTVLIHATLIQHFGSGPLWTKTVAALQKPCQYFWWSALLHIQNYVNSQHICVVPTWYLTCDMLYYWFAPLIVYPLWRWRYFGWINFGVIYVLSITINFYLAWIHEYEASVLVTPQLLHTRYFTKHYIIPHTRAGTFLLGIGCGSIFYQTRNAKIKMSPLVVTIGWISSLLLLLVVIVSNHVFQLENHDYDRLEDSLYISLTRSAWTLGLIWIVWACKHGYGGPVNHFLSHPVFQVLGKLAFGIFLWHMTLQFLSNGTLKLPVYFADFNLLYKLIGDIVVVSTFSLVFTVCVECPTVKLARSFFK